MGLYHDSNIFGPIGVCLRMAARCARLALSDISVRICNNVMSLRRTWLVLSPRKVFAAASAGKMPNAKAEAEVPLNAKGEVSHGANVFWQIRSYLAKIQD